MACIAVLALLAPVCYQSWARYRATRVADTDTKQALLRAVELEPGDAAYQERLARYLAFVDLDVAEAKEHYELAAAMNPYSARTWLGLANVEMVSGDEASAAESIRKALEVDPKTPSVAWEAANLFLSLGRTPEALQQIRFVLANEVQIRFQALDLVHRVTAGSPKDALAALPPDPAVYFAYVTILLRKNEVPAAKDVWSGLIGLKQSFDPKLGFYVIDDLMRRGDISGAIGCWNDMRSVVPEIARLAQDGNVVSNGSFEFDPLNGGFDWRFSESPTRMLRFDVSSVREGRRSLLMSFHDSRLTGLGIIQFVPLQANTHYAFGASVISKLQTANGVQFAIVNPISGQKLMLTDEAVTTRGWQKLEAKFTTGDQAQIAILTITRSASSLIRGEIWIDDVQLRKVNE